MGWNVNLEIFELDYTLRIVFYLKANIQSIMASEKQVNILMQLLDEALGEVDTIEGKLSSYEEMLQSVKEQMDQISQSNRLIQISNTNNGKLLDEIQFLVVRDAVFFHWDKLLRETTVMNVFNKCSCKCTKQNNNFDKMLAWKIIYCKCWIVVLLKLLVLLSS